jgi:hypothetical protein
VYSLLRRIRNIAAPIKTTTATTVRDFFRAPATYDLTGQLIGRPSKTFVYGPFSWVARALYARGGGLANQLADVGFAQPGATEAMVVQAGVNGNADAS